MQPAFHVSYSTSYKIAWAVSSCQIFASQRCFFRKPSILTGGIFFFLYYQANVKAHEIRLTSKQFKEKAE